MVRYYQAEDTAVVKALKEHPFFVRLKIDVHSYAVIDFYHAGRFAKCMLCERDMAMAEKCYEFRCISPESLGHGFLIYYTHKECSDILVNDARDQGRKEANARRKDSAEKAKGKSKQYGKKKGYLKDAFAAYLKEGKH